MNIVKRLRDYANGLSGYAADMMVEAANEIEKLREDNFKMWTILCDTPYGEIAHKAADEIERLREALWDLEQYVSRADHFYLKPETLAALKEGE